MLYEKDYQSHITTFVCCFVNKMYGFSVDRNKFFGNKVLALYSSSKTKAKLYNVSVRNKT